MNGKLGFVRRRGRESLYLLAAFPLLLAYFVFTVTMVTTSVSLIVVWIGVPLLAVTLLGASKLAAFERVRARLLGAEIAKPPRLDMSDLKLTSVWKRWGRRLKNGESWMAVLHHVVVFPVATVTFSIVVSWWAVAFGGLTAVIWYRFIPRSADSIGLADLLQLWLPETALYTVIGVVFLVTLPWVVHALAVTQLALAKALLSPSRRSLESRITDLEHTKTAAVDAELVSMRKLERDLHDGPQQRLIRLGMDLSTAERRLDSGDVEHARGVINEAKSQVEETLAELRNLSRGIAPPILVDRGLVVALTTLAAGATVPVTFETSASEDTRLALPVENAVYFCASEAMANIAKHSGASRAWMSLTLGDKAVLLVTDDGQGGAELIPGHGLSGLHDRAASVGGTLNVASGFGRGTVVRLEIPLV